MLFNVPQYIDVEDKVAGPLTAKQLLWLFGMGAVLLVLWGIFDKTTFIILAIPIALVFGALAFYRPYGRPLISFVISAFMFMFRPKVYFWRRESEHRSVPVVSPKEGIEIGKGGTAGREPKRLEEDKLKMFAKILDSRGNDSDERIIELMRKKQSR